MRKEERRRRARRREEARERGRERVFVQREQEGERGGEKTANSVSRLCSAHRSVIVRAAPLCTVSEAAASPSLTCLTPSARASGLLVQVRVRTYGFKSPACRRGAPAVALLTSGRGAARCALIRVAHLERAVRRGGEGEEDVVV